MYVPAHFAPEEGAVADLLANHGAADLVTSTARGMLATLLPFVYDAEAGSLLGHVARNNEQWKEPALGDALVIVRGPDFYVSPTWYPSKREHGRAVPTWNYLTAHVYGRLVIHDDTAWLDRLVRRLTAKHEGHRSEPWTVDDAPEKFVAGQLRAIVGVEVVIDRVEAKFKMNQNRPDADVDGVIAGVAADGDEPGAAAMRKANGR